MKKKTHNLTSTFEKSISAWLLMNPPHPRTSSALIFNENKFILIKKIKKIVRRNILINEFWQKNYFWQIKGVFTIEYRLFLSADWLCVRSDLGQI